VREARKPKEAQFVVYCAIDIPAAHSGQVLWKRNAVTGLPEAYVPKLGEDQEVCQFASEVPKKPLTERAFKAIMDQMTQAMMEKARAAGLVI